MFERFTQRARHAVVLAQEEARALQHHHIGTEHILLGLLREGEGVAARVLGSLGVSLDRTRPQIARIVGPTDEVTAEQTSAAEQIPFTPRAKKVLELALREALALGHDYIGTEHILLGLAREGDGIAMRVLLDLDVRPEQVRDEVIRVLPHSERQARGRPAGTLRVSEFTITVVPDRDLRRLLMAAAGRALKEEREEFGLSDLLAAAEEGCDPPDAGDAAR